jgi:hypothetical protein
MPEPPSNAARTPGPRLGALSISTREAVPAGGRVPPLPPLTGSLALRERLRVTRRGVQVALGVIWLLAGLLQFQSYMYTHGFVTDVLQSTAVGQPSFIGKPIISIAAFYGRDLTLWNTLAAEIQCMIGLGLIASRKTVRPALAVSLAWSLAVWWLGEGFGLLTSHTEPSALMGAPGAVIIYAMIGLAVWPKKAAGTESSANEAINDRVASYAWALLWVISAILWLLNVNRSKNAIHDMLTGMAGMSPHWLASWQNSVARATQGHGEVIAVALAVVSLVVALGVFSPALRLPIVTIGIALSLAYWVLGQSLGGPFWAGQATDVNAGPLFILLGVALLPGGRRTAKAPERRQTPPAAAVATS